MDTLIKLRTSRLWLQPLTISQLRLYPDNLARLDGELGFPVSRAVVTTRVERAIDMKLARMEGASVQLHPWQTYWLMVVQAAPFGAGLIGFKGFPDSAGEAEIGYGIDPAWQGQGYTTEAVKALIAWAFREPGCQAVVARDTKRSNVASLRVQAKAGLTVYRESEDALWLRIER